MKLPLRYLALASLFALPGAAGAENLRQAWSDAIATHNQLAAAAARRDAAGLNLESAEAERWPQLDVTSSFTQLDEAPRCAPLAREARDGHCERNALLRHAKADRAADAASLSPGMLDSPCSWRRHIL